MGGRHRHNHQSSAQLPIGLAKAVLLLALVPVAATNADEHLVMPGSETVGLAWDGSTFWASVRDKDRGGIYSQNADGTWNRFEKYVSRFPGSLAWDGQALWVVEDMEGTISRIDTTTGQHLSHIPLPRAARRPWPAVTGLTWDGRSLWLVAKGGLCACLLRLDPECASHDAEQCVLQHIFPKCEPRGVAYQHDDDGKEYLWIVAYNGPGHAPLMSWRRFDDDRATIIRTLGFSPTLLPVAEPSALTFAKGLLWVADRSGVAVPLPPSKLVPPAVTAGGVHLTAEPGTTGEKKLVSASVVPIPTPVPQGPRKFAVLVSTEMASKTPDQVSSNTDFWTDLVLTYRMLLSQGFAPEDIFVLYGNGKDCVGDQNHCVGLPDWYFKSLPVTDEGVGGDLQGTKITDCRLTLVAADADPCAPDPAGSNTLEPMLAKDNICHVLCCLATGSKADVQGNESDKKCTCTEPATPSEKCTWPLEVPKLTQDDFLFLWSRGHGELDSMSNTLLDVGWDYLGDDELQGLLKPLATTRRVLSFDTCYSGGWLDDIAALDSGSPPSKTTVALASSSGVEPSNSVWSEEEGVVTQENGTFSLESVEVLHGWFTTWFAAAYSSPLGVATNELVSVQNAFDLAKDKVSGSGYTPEQIGAMSVCTPEPTTMDTLGPDACEQTPEIQDSGGVAPCLYLRLPQPGRDAEAYAKDHVHDVGTVPSDSEPWWHGPDLWVRNTDDGQPEHQDPVYGVDNHAYARIHNIGCATLVDAKVGFAWSEPTAWSSPDNWVPLNGDPASSTVTLTDVQPQNDAVAHLVWAGEHIPLPGSYCLHATLNAPPDDVAKPNSRAFEDNNRVQVNLSVVGGAAGIPVFAWFWIENHSEDDWVDLVVDPADLPPATAITVSLPPGLDPVALHGAQITTDAAAWTVITAVTPSGHSQRPPRPINVRLALAPGVRRRALLRLAGPPGATGPQPAAILRIEERTGNKVGGGLEVRIQPDTLPKLEGSLATTLPAAITALRRALLGSSASSSPLITTGHRTEEAHRPCGPKLKVCFKELRGLEPAVLAWLHDHAPELATRSAEAFSRLHQGPTRTAAQAVELGREQLFLASILLSELRMHPADTGADAP